jgi:hypothetical protein
MIPLTSKESFAARNTAVHTIHNRPSTRENGSGRDIIETSGTLRMPATSRHGNVDPFAHFGLPHPVQHGRSSRKNALLHPGKHVRAASINTPFATDRLPTRRSRQHHESCVDWGWTVRPGHSQVQLHVQVSHAGGVEPKRQNTSTAEQPTAIQSTPDWKSRVPNSGGDDRDFRKDSPPRAPAEQPRGTDHSRPASEPRPYRGHPSHLPPSRPHPRTRAAKQAPLPRSAPV